MNQIRCCRLSDAVDDSVAVVFSSCLIIPNTLPLEKQDVFFCFFFKGRAAGSALSQSSYISLIQSNHTESSGTGGITGELLWLILLILLHDENHVCPNKP